MMGYLKGLTYRMVMRIAHKYNWHYAPPIYPDGDKQLWCKWCGFRETILKTNNSITENEPKEEIIKNGRYNND